MRLRVDATAATGAGHAMRLSTLGEAWLAAGGHVVAAGRCELGFVADRYARLGIEWRDDAGDPDVEVVDSYQASVRAEPARAAIRVIVDDLGDPIPPGTAAVWNPNPFGTAALYPTFTGPVLGGPDLVPIRSDLPRWRPGGREVVVSFGGGTSCRRLGPPPGDHWVVVAGAAEAPAGWRTAPREDWWRRAAQAKAVIIAAGITLWEAAAVGVPVVAVQVAANQRLSIEWAARSGVPAALTDPAVPLPDQLAALAAGARALPPLINGAPAVAARLLAMVAAGRSS